jgi:hypothetical protein
MRNVLFTLSALLCLMASDIHSQQTPTTIANVRDGTIRDVAAGQEWVLVAQGGRIAFFDMDTEGSAERLLTPLFLDGFTYPGEVGAIEWDEENADIFVVVRYFTAGNCTDESAMTSLVHYHKLSAGSGSTTAQAPQGGDIVDIKMIPEHRVLVVATGEAVGVLDYSSGAIQPFSPGAENGFVPKPDGMALIKRLHVHKNTNGKFYAYVVGTLQGVPSRDLKALGMIDLNSEENFRELSVVDLNMASATSQIWDPRLHFGAKASTNYLQIISDASIGTDTAWIACGMGQGVTEVPTVATLELAAAGASPLPAPEAIPLDAPGSVSGAVNIVGSANGARMYVATENVVHVVDTALRRTTSSRNVGFFDGGPRDMAWVALEKEGIEAIWVGNGNQGDNLIHGIQVYPGQPKPLAQRWWISSSDGVVAVPEWNSIYLPTFGGICRYDLSKGETKPEMVHDSFSYVGHGNGPVEHIDFLRLGSDNGLVVTVNGGGGVQAYPVSASSPNPGSPQTAKANPSPVVYANDVAAYTSPAGRHYILADVTDRISTPTNTHYLQAFVYDPSTRILSHLVDSPPVSSPVTGSGKSGAIASVVAVCGNHAIVGGQRILFIVDLRGLDEDPPRLEIVGDPLVETPGSFSFRGIACDGKYLFTSYRGDGGGIRSYEFFPEATPPLSLKHTLTEGPECRPLHPIGRLRLHPSEPRLYLCGEGGRLIEIAYDPGSGALTALSVWHSGLAQETQDARLYDFGSGIRVLFAKNNEAFAIVDFQAPVVRSRRRR